MRFEINSKGRDFVVGDLHGHYDLFMEELNKVNFNREVDRVFSVGDLIDRGPASDKCLMLIDKPWFHAVRGNHEQLMILAIKQRDPSAIACWYSNGGQWALDFEEDEMFCFAEMADSLPWTIEVETNFGLVGICHAESKQNWLDNNPKEEDTLLWAREKVFKQDHSLVDGVERVYVGHTPLRNKMILGNTHYIDTGAFCYGNLLLEELK